jgi:hypothetical protein
MQQVNKSSVSREKNQKSTAKLKLKSKASAMVASFKKESKNNKNKKNKIKLMAQQEELQKKVNDPVEIEQKKIESEHIEKKPTQENQKEVNQQEINTDAQSLEQDEPSLEEVIFVGYEQFDECVISSKIQQAVVASWTPPVGIDAGTACEMKIKVSVQGIADAVEIIKSSGVLLYDTSARTALSQVEFPKEVHGKIIRIVLGN